MKFFNLRNPWMWVVFLLIISVTFGFIHKFTGTHWSYIAAFAPWGPLVLFAIVGIVFAWIINPIRALIKRRKEKKKKEAENK